MVMSMLVTSRGKAGRKGLLLRPGRFGARLHADGVSFPGVKGPSSPMKPSLLGGPGAQGSGSV